MKTISNYILERLNPKHLGTRKEFPDTNDIEEIVKFLKINGFTEMPFIGRYQPIVTGEKRMIEDMNNMSKPVFIFVPKGMAKWVMIGNTTNEEISKDNPLYYYDTGRAYHTLFFEGYQLKEHHLSHKDWLESINKHIF